MCLRLCGCSVPFMNVRCRRQELCHSLWDLETARRGRLPSFLPNAVCVMMWPGLLDRNRVVSRSSVDLALPDFLCVKFFMDLCSNIGGLWPGYSV